MSKSIDEESQKKNCDDTVNDSQRTDRIDSEHDLHWENYNDDMWSVPGSIISPAGPRTNEKEIKKVIIVKDLNTPGRQSVSLLTGPESLYMKPRNSPSAWPILNRNSFCSKHSFGKDNCSEKSKANKKEPVLTKVKLPKVEAKEIRHRKKAKKLNRVLNPKDKRQHSLVDKVRRQKKDQLNPARNLKNERKYHFVTKGESPQRETTITRVPFYLLDQPRSGRRFMYFIGDLPEPEAIAVKAQSLKMSMLRMTRVWIMNCGQGLNVRAANQIGLPDVYVEFLASQEGRKYKAYGKTADEDFVSENEDRNRGDIYAMNGETRTLLEVKRKMRMDKGLFVGPILDEPIWTQCLPKGHFQRINRTTYGDDGILRPVLEYLLDEGDFRIVCNPTKNEPRKCWYFYDDNWFDFIDTKIQREKLDEGFGSESLWT